MTTHPSQFAASLNQIGVPYKFAYSVSLTLRYIPDVQEEFFTIRKAQEARGLDLSQKVGLVKRIRGNLQIVLPLIFHLSNELIPYRQPWSYDDLVATKTYMVCA